MPAAWPATLPQRLLLDGASLGVGDGLLENLPDTGPSIVRRRSTAAPRPLSGYLMLSDAQMTTFEAFFYTTIMSGALPFTFPDPRTGATLLVRFTKQSLPAYVPQGGDNYRLSFNVMVLP